jgi:hypothetical protein
MRQKRCWSRFETVRRGDADRSLCLYLISALSSLSASLQLPLSHLCITSLLISALSLICLISVCIYPLCLYIYTQGVSFYAASSLPHSNISSLSHHLPLSALLCLLPSLSLSIYHISVHTGWVSFHGVSYSLHITFHPWHGGDLVRMFRRSLFLPSVGTKKCVRNRSGTFQSSFINFYKMCGTECLWGCLKSALVFHR